MRRDLDIPGEARDEAGVSGTTQTRTLVDFNLPYFKKWKWPADQPIPYMFDGTHSESYSKMINLIWNVWQLCESFFSIFLMANVANIVKPTNILRVQLSEGKSSDSWNIHTLRKRDWESIVPGRNAHTGLRQDRYQPIVSYSSSPVPCTGPSPVPVRCEQAISHTVCSQRVFCSTPANRVT